MHLSIKSLAIGVALLALALFWFTGGDRTQPQLEPLAADARILAFGNSLTHGTGATPEESYPAVLAELIGREVIRSGVPGEETAAGRERLPGVLDDVEPDLLILMHGGNDILRDRAADRITANLMAMVELAQARGIAVVMVGIPERSLFSRVAELYEEVAGAHDVPLETGIIRAILGDDALTSDPIHPNAAGYRRLAEAIRDLLVTSGALRAQSARRNLPLDWNERVLAEPKQDNQPQASTSYAESAIALR